jgi:Phage late-transcription coactivator
MPTREEKDKFSLMVEDMVARMSISYIDAITEHCSKSGMEMEIAATLINPTLKSKIELEARALNFLPKQDTLPI